MKTKTRKPWNIKPGDQVAVYLYPDQESPFWVEVRRISKGRALFTGRTHWRLHYTCPLSGHETWVSLYGLDKRHHPRIAAWEADSIQWKGGKP
jgi:hypothetical protein